MTKERDFIYALGKKMIQKKALLKFLEQFINCNGQLILPISSVEGGVGNILMWPERGARCE